MRPTWVLSAPDRPHVGPMNLAIRVPFPIAVDPKASVGTASSNCDLVESDVLLEFEFTVTTDNRVVALVANSTMPHSTPSGTTLRRKNETPCQEKGDRIMSLA